MCDKKDNFCVDRMPSSCLEYDGKLGTNTKIESKCVNQFQVNEDLYDSVDLLHEMSDVSDLESEELGIEKESTVAEVILAYKTEIESLKEKVNELESINYSEIDIRNFGLDFPEEILDSCDNTPITLGNWMQIIMDNLKTT